MKTILEYAKKAREAYINYISSNNYNQEICEEISKCINNIENLTTEQSKRLNDFINANTTNVKDLADIYMPQSEKYTMRDKFKRIVPMKLSKPTSTIYKAEGRLENFIINNGPIKIRKKVKIKPIKPVQ